MIKNLVLNDFRNYFSCKINTANSKNIVITGPNGSGKTAILEAISMLSGDRGMRGAPINFIPRFDGSGGFAVFADLKNDNEICVYYEKDDSNRHVKINGDRALLSELDNMLRIVWLTPKEDRLFLDSGKEIRSFFDRMVGSFNPSHFGRTAKLSKLFNERANALRLSADKNWLDTLDKQIAETSVAVAAARLSYLSELNYFLTKSVASTNGVLETDILNSSATDAEKKYFEYLIKNRNLINDKMVLDGVHKSEFLVFNKELNLAVYMTSTGQQKSVLIDLILAHAKLINAKTDKSPIILLDEFASHLDSETINKMFSELNSANAQVWITGLTPELFSGLSDTLFVSCKNGTIDNIV